MAQLSINDKYIVNGRLTVKRSINEEGEIFIQGVLATHLYFEEIGSIDSYRYRLEDIEVLEESFGSEDHDIIYKFEAKELEVKGGMTVLNPKYITNIESKLYEEDGFIKGSLYSEEENNE